MKLSERLQPYSSSKWMESRFSVIPDKYEDNLRNFILGVLVLVINK